MTPQGHFTVVAPLAPGREADLRQLLVSMTVKPGLADPHNEVLPFDQFKQLHFARLVLLDDALQEDLLTVGAPRRRLPTLLAWMGDCDGPARDCLAAMVEHAGAGLCQLFSHCEGFEPGADLLGWLIAHDRPAQVSYVNWVGRTVQQIGEERALQVLLAEHVSRGPLGPGEAKRLHAALRDMVGREMASGRLTLTPPRRTPLGWQVANLLNAVAILLVGPLLAPVLIVALPLLAWQLRTLEESDPEICPRVDGEALRTLEAQEDHDISNQYSAIGPIKPGWFRRWLVIGLLAAINFACRHVFTRGHLARVQTIHFARWVLLDDNVRLLFASNYDGSHQAYMDDFINKAAWGLNLSFSHGVGWPRTHWLLFGGARLEQQFKHYQRRHQVPTQVWYKAYPGMSLAEINRNQKIREGLERATMSDADAMGWLKLL